MLGQCFETTFWGTTTGTNALIAGLFAGGLVGGFSHCTWMCGPFVLAQMDTQHSKKSGKMASASRALLLPYHFGRITTYVCLAVLLNTVINLAFVFSPLKALISAPLLTLAGVVFLVTAFPKLSTLFPWATTIRLGVPVHKINALLPKIHNKRTPLGRYLMGVLLGFMPCGLVISALMAAAAAPSPLYAACAMAAFALGTVPALLSVALGANIIKHKYPLITSYFSRAGMLASSLWLFVLAGWVAFQAAALAL